MEELVYLSKKGNPVTNSRLVAEKFKKHHKHVLEAIDNLILQVSDNQGPKSRLGKFFHQIDDIVKFGGKEQNNRMFLMTRQGFALLVMGFNGKKAMEFKLDYIDQFDKMEEELSKKNQITVPGTYGEALRLAADLSDKNDILEKQKKELEEKVQEAAPKVEYYDAFADRSVLTNFRDTANMLKKACPTLTLTSFVSELLGRNYIYREPSGELRAYADKVDKGYFELKEWGRIVKDKDFGGMKEKSGLQTLITFRGREKFLELFSKHKPE